MIDLKTIGANVQQIKYKNIDFLMWDIGGQETIRQHWSSYFMNAKALIMVVDSTDKERLGIVRDELHKIVDHDTIKDASLLVFANKQDVKGGLSATQISEILKLTSLKDRQWHIQGCCALTGEGLFQGLDWIVSKLT